MPTLPPKPMSVGRAMSCALVNQLATPGLGSLMGRRLLAGIGQLVLAVAGFILLTTWIGALCYRLICEAMEKPATWNPQNWMWLSGAILFGLAWLWSLATSISLVLQAKADERSAQTSVPPRITNPPSKM